MEEAGIIEKDEPKSSQETQADEERLQRFQDSASTLNPGSSLGGASVSQSYELQPTEDIGGVMGGASMSATLTGGVSSEEGNSQQVG